MIQSGEINGTGKPHEPLFSGLIKQTHLLAKYFKRSFPFYDKFDSVTLRE